MLYRIEAAKGSATAATPLLSAAEAVRKMEDAEALGLAAVCTDISGNMVSKQDLLAAVRSA